jgi:ribose 5-phosphate isomerase RpiB
MSANGRVPESSAGSRVLHWPGRVLAASDLRRSLNGHRELVLAPGTVVTPLAQEELRQGGVQVTRREPERKSAAGPAAWGYAEERPTPLVRSAVQALAREGVEVRELPGAGPELLCRWARGVAECVARGECAGGVLFCGDAGLACCVANKVPGLRAVAVTTATQAARSALVLAANLVAVEVPGRTFFEVRQILRTLCAGAPGSCPEGLACTLRELDGHAHR